MFTVTDLKRLEFGDTVQVGELDDQLVSLLGLKAPWVYLSPSSLKHIRSRHPDVSDWDILTIPRVLSF